MSEISTATRQELVQAVGERYRTVSAEEKGRILDEFVALAATTATRYPRAQRVHRYTSRCEAQAPEIV